MQRNNDWNRRRRGRGRRVRSGPRCPSRQGEAAAAVGAPAPAPAPAASRFPPVWLELRNSHQFCDGTVESADGRIFRIHKVILAAVSEYFKALFTSSLASPGSYFRLRFNHRIVESIVDYAYTGSCHVSQENVEELLPAADQLGVVAVVEICSEFLSSQLNESNCWGIHQFAKSYFRQELSALAWDFTLNNFEAFFSQSPEFLDMKAEDLAKLLLSDALNVTGEEQVFNAVDKWVKENLETRKRHAGTLLGCIRFGLVSRDFFLGSVMRAPYTTEVPYGFVDNIRLMIDRKFFGDMERLNSMDPMSRPRIPYEILFAIGGWTGGTPTNYFSTYDIRSNMWLASAYRDETPRSYHGLVALNNLIYMVGGFDGTTHLNSVRCFDPATKLWSEKACMYQARCYVALALLDGTIYAIGGFNGRARMNSVERYSAELNQWEKIAPMFKHRSDAGAASHNGKIVVAGGFDGHRVLDNVEMFSLETGNWTLIQSMNSPRSGLSLVSFRGHVWALGGYNGYMRLSSVEKLDPDGSRAVSRWETGAATMNSLRSNFGCAVLDNTIYVIGGFNGSTTVPWVEYLEREERGWVNSSQMILNRSAFAVAVCRGLPNAIEFTFNSHDYPSI